MQQSDLISVIVTVYRVEAYIVPCVESILAQSYKNLEIILVDDGSPDNSGKICEEFACRDPRVRVIHRENGGQGAAKNTGIDSSNGRYLMFVDGDDTIHSRMVEILYRELKRRKALVSISNYYRVKPPAPVEKELGGVAVKEMSGCDFLYRTMYWSPCGRLFDRKLFQKRRFDPKQYYEDFYLITRIVGILDKVVVIDKPPLYYYVQRPASLTRGSEKMARRDLFESAAANIHYFSGSGLTSGQKEKMYCMHFMEGMRVLLRNDTLEKGSVRVLRSCILRNGRRVAKSRYMSRYGKTLLFSILILGSIAKNFFALEKLGCEEEKIKGRGI